MKRFILALALLAFPFAGNAQTADVRFPGGMLMTVNTPPLNGTNVVETLTFGGTITGGTFTLQFLGTNTAPITWSATNATLVSNISTALNAIPTVGTAGFTVAVGTMTAGIGTITATATAGGNLGAMVQPAIVVVTNALTGTAPTLTSAITTPGVQADGRKSIKGTIIVAGDGRHYSNLGVPLAPNWTKLSAE